MDRELIAVGSVLEAALDLAVGFGLRDGVPLIVELFASAEADLDLEAGALEVDLEGDQVASISAGVLRSRDLIGSCPQTTVTEKISASAKNPIHQG